MGNVGRLPVKRVVVGLVILVAAVAGSSGPHAATLVFAHRGDTSAAPENTVDAIAAAVPWADGVEFDIWLAADGTFRLRHDPLPDAYEALPTLDAAIGAAGDLLLDIDLKDDRAIAAEALGAWIAANRIGERTSVNVKSIEAARILVRLVPQITIEAQPEWVPTAVSAPEVQIVVIWGENWRDVLNERPPSQVGLFVNSIHEPGLSRYAEAVAAGIFKYYADGPPR
jgi:hypothetical protein